MSTEDRVNRLISETISVIDDMFYKSETINFYTVAEKAMVSRSFLYNHSELRSRIERYKSIPDDYKFDERYKTLVDNNKQLLARLQAYDEQLIKLLKADT